MKKNKRIVVSVIVFAFILLIATISNAAEVDVTRSIYSNNGSMKFTFTGLTLDPTHEYEFGLTRTSAEQVETWHLITEYTASTATVDVITTTNDLRQVINKVDSGYITIKDKTTSMVVLQPYAVDLKTPFLNVTNYTVIPNGKEFNNEDLIQIALRCASNSEAYYQYEKITDESIIKKYEEIKAQNGNIMELESMLKTTVPTSNWISWDYWNGHDYFAGMNGFGHTQKKVSVPDSGLYYMWVYFSGNDLKNVYGYILVDNLSNNSQNDTNQDTSNDNTLNTLENITGNTTGKTDSTIANKILPNTGISIAIVGTILLVTVLGIGALAKYYTYKDVK